MIPDVFTPPHLLKIVNTRKKNSDLVGIRKNCSFGVKLER